MNNLIVNLDILKKSVFKGSLASLTLLSVYFLILTLVSGWKFTWEQFSQFWYYVVSLAVGFGIQFSLYSYLRGVVKQKAASGKVLTTTGATSTGAMISCCAHYLVNLLPILGTTGIITFISQYQVQFFWLGLLFNLLGILYIGNKVINIAGIKVNKLAILYGIFLVVIATFFVINNTSIKINSSKVNALSDSGCSSTSCSAPTSNTQAASNSLDAKEDTQGAVSVAVTPQNLNDSSWNFEVSLNTHSEELSADLVAVSELVDDQGKSYKPTTWEGAPPGGHHRSGVLKFNPISPKPKSIEIKIKNVGGIKERSFKWNL